MNEPEPTPTPARRPQQRSYKSVVRKKRPWHTEALVWLGGWVAYVMIRLLLATVRMHVVGRDEAERPTDEGRGFIMCAWHQNILVPVRTHRHRNMAALVSTHRDADILALMMQHAGTHVVRGSTGRGGIRAMKEMVTLARNGKNFMVAVDGPKGPRHVVGNGVVFLAQKTGCRVSPVGVAFARCWQLKSWDRFRIPKPFTRLVGYYGESFVIPDRIDSDQREQYRQKLQDELDRVTVEARRLLEDTGSSRSE